MAHSNSARVRVEYTSYSSSLSLIIRLKYWTKFIGFVLEGGGGGVQKLKDEERGGSEQVREGGKRT